MIIKNTLVGFEPTQGEAQLRTIEYQLLFIFILIRYKRFYSQQRDKKQMCGLEKENKRCSNH